MQLQLRELLTRFAPDPDVSMIALNLLWQEHSENVDDGWRRLACHFARSAILALFRHN
jgi:hypothetical protein